MSAQRGEFQQGNDEAAFMALIVLIPIFIFIGWIFIGKYLYAYERLAVYWVLSVGGLVPTDVPVWGWFTRQYLFFRYTSPSDIGYFDNAMYDSFLINMVLLIPIGIMTIRKYHFIDQNHPFAKYGRQMNLYDYMYELFPLYPHLRTTWKLRLLSRPLDKGLFRKPDSVKQLCVLNDMVALPFVDGEPVVNESKAKDFFRAQLGTLMPKLTDDAQKNARNLLGVLSNNELAILSAVVPRLAACDEEATDEVYKAGIEASKVFVNQFWLSFDAWHPQMPSKTDDVDAPLCPPPPPVDTSGCEEALMKYLVMPFVQQSMTKHAYVLTYIYDAIQLCRRVGKFPPCDLRWLMMSDRVFWLLISSAGRREPFWECAGIHAHYLYERKLKMPCEFPQVAEAVYALVDELENRVAFSVREKQQMLSQQDEATTSQARQRTESKARDELRQAKLAKAAEATKVAEAARAAE